LAELASTTAEIASAEASKKLQREAGAQLATPNVVSTISTASDLKKGESS
jgi:hypothetical protein